MIDFSPLWETMKKKNISTYKLITQYNVSKGTIDNLKQNRSVTLHTIDILHVPIEHIVKITIDDSEKD